jgi:hypothetical protein
MTPDAQITAWKHPDALAPHALGTYAPDPAGDPELPHEVGGDGLFFDLLPARSEYLVTLGCCQGITTDAVGCGFNTWTPCLSLFCVNTLTLT